MNQDILHVCQQALNLINLSNVKILSLNQHFSSLFFLSSIINTIALTTYKALY